MLDIDNKIIAFFKKLDREYFMDFNKEYAYLDEPLSIGHGQTISQPSLVLEMTMRLDLSSDVNILEIGTGSGYQTAFLAQFSNKVYTVEIIESLYEKAKDRLENYGFDNISFKLGDGSYGWKEHAPYDRIIVTASSTTVPYELIEQLALGGKMIIPIGPRRMQELVMIQKDMSGTITQNHIEYVRFVRLVGEYD